MPNLPKIKYILFKSYTNSGLFSDLNFSTDMLDELQDHVESIDMANG